MARPTLADVARESGVSSGAVSLILRDQGRFSDETRERVLQAARQVDYRPHPFLSQPKTGKFKASKTTSAVPIALLWKYHDPIVEATDAFAERLGYQLNKIEFTEEMNAVHFGNTLYARGYSGIILGQLYSKNALPDLGWSRFATVCVGRPFFPVPFDVVREELTESFIQLFRTCRGRGCRDAGPHG